MHRFFISPADFEGERLSISGENFNRITRVLRMVPGDRFVAVCPEGDEYVVEICRRMPHQVIGKVITRGICCTEPSTEITLMQGIAKGNKMDLIVQKCTEIGIKRIVPISTERTVIQLDKDKAESRRGRWQKIAKEAAEQSRRSFIPVIEEIMSLKDAICREKDKVILTAWEGETSRSIKTVLKSLEPKRPIVLCIGPEGGFSQSEVDLITSYGGISVSLGPRILRTETAGMVAVSLVLYEFGDI